MEVLIILTWAIVFTYCTRKPINIIHIAIVDSMLPVRFYESLAGIPFSFIFFLSIVISLYSNGRTVVLKFNKYIMFFIATSTFFFLSNYSYFKQFDFTIFNNIFLIFVVQSSMKNTNLENVWENILKSFVLMGLILSVDSFLPGELFGNPRQLGFYLLISIVFCISGQKLGLKTFLFSRKVLIILFIAMIITFGRLNFAIGLIILVSSFFYNRRISLERVIFSALVVSSTGIILLGPLGKEYFLRDQSTVSDIEFDIKDKGLAAVSSGRSVIYEDALQMFYDNPIFGFGYKSFNDLQNPYNSIRAYGAEQKISLHSVFLQYLSEAGVIGFMLYFGSLIILIRASRKIKTQGFYSGQQFGLFNSISWIFFILPIIMILGSFFDNHGIHYKHIFILLGFLTCLLPQIGEKNFKLSSI